MQYFKSQNQCKKYTKNKIKTGPILLFSPFASGSNVAPSGTISVSDPGMRERRENVRGSWERPPTRLHSGTICPPQDSSLWVEAGPLAVLWPPCPTPSLFLPQRDTQLVGMGGDLPHTASLFPLLVSHSSLQCFQVLSTNTLLSQRIRPPCGGKVLAAIFIQYGFTSWSQPIQPQRRRPLQVSPQSL